MRPRRAVCVALVWAALQETEDICEAERGFVLGTDALKEKKTLLRCTEWSLLGQGKVKFK